MESTMALAEELQELIPVPKSTKAIEKTVCCANLSAVARALLGAVITTFAFAVDRDYLSDDTKNGLFIGLWIAFLCSSVIQLCVDYQTSQDNQKFKNEYTRLLHRKFNPQNQNYATMATNSSRHYCAGQAIRTEDKKPVTNGGDEITTEGQRFVIVAAPVPTGKTQINVDANDETKGRWPQIKRDIYNLFTFYKNLHSQVGPTYPSVGFKELQDLLKGSRTSCVCEFFLPFFSFLLNIASLCAGAYVLSLLFAASSPAENSSYTTSQTLSDPLTRERELAGLLEALQTYDLAEGYILTEQESGEEHIQLVDKTVRIRIMPVWRWLVNN
jgi:hypothetical protein